MFVDAAARRLSVNDDILGVTGSRFCDVCSKFYMDTNYGRRWHLDTNGCTGVSDFFRQIDDILSGLPEVAAALEITRALPVVLRGGVYFLNGLELVREECGSVFLDPDGRTHAQACCYLAIARASTGGAAAVNALGGLCDSDSNARSARLGAVRASLTPFAAPLKKLLVPNANIAARERGLQMSIPAEDLIII
jgi:hypothetical protein